MPLVAAVASAGPVSEQSSAQIRADSLSIANLYGSVPAAVLVVPPVIYDHPRPYAIAAVTELDRVVPPRDATAHEVDTYA